MVSYKALRLYISGFDSRSYGTLLWSLILSETPLVADVDIFRKLLKLWSDWWFWILGWLGALGGEFGRMVKCGKWQLVGGGISLCSVGANVELVTQSTLMKLNYVTDSLGCGSFHELLNFWTDWWFRILYWLGGFGCELFSFFLESMKQISKNLSSSLYEWMQSIFKWQPLTSSYLTMKWSNWYITSLSQDV